MEKMRTFLFDFVRSEVLQKNGENDLRERFFSLTAEERAQLYWLAKTHDLCHLIGAFLEKCAVADDESTIKFKEEFYLAIFRCEHLKNTLERLEKTLEANEIPYVTLKGAVIRQWYAEPWMRTSCDIDILVRESDLEKAKSVLIEQEGFVYQNETSHDIAFFSSNHARIELHHGLIEEEVSKAAANVLKDIWEVAGLRDGTRFAYEMPISLLYFYHIAHMAKHLKNGGCGVRSFIDLWILERLGTVDPVERDRLLSEGDLLQFANAARKLCEVWFEGGEADELSLQMQNFVLSGGAYGSLSNRIVLQRQKKGGPVKYMLSRVFIPRDALKMHYPILEKHRWMTPFMEVRRWLKLVFCGHMGRVSREIKYNYTISNEDMRNVQKLLDDLGLSS